MKIFVSKNAGFCMGVRRAINVCVGLVHRHKNDSVYTFGPLIHNKNVTSELASIGAKCVDKFDDLPSEGVVLIRSHGLSPSDREKIKSTGVLVSDATCPKVARVQGIIKKHVADGFYVLIHGDHGHAEVNGLLGYAGNSGKVISNMEELEKFLSVKENYENRKFCVVAQTTQEPNLFNEFSEKLRSYCREAVIINTICDATENRQKDLREIPDNITKIIIVGGKHSANTTRLAQLAKDAVKDRNCNVYHIESPDELTISDFDEKDNIFISAGASTPQWLIEEVIDKVKYSKSKFYKLFTNEKITNIIWSLVIIYSFFTGIYNFTALTLLFLTYSSLHTLYLRKLDKVKVNAYYKPKLFLVLSLSIILSLYLFDLISVFFAALIPYNLLLLLYFSYFKSRGKYLVMALLNMNVVLTFFYLIFIDFFIKLGGT
jgi:(E)-4-hydroxy-3-methyl-but-2-enyl pyrophosphate reductase